LHVRCCPGPAIDCVSEATALFGVQVPSHGWPRQWLRSTCTAASARQPIGAGQECRISGMFDAGPAPFDVPTGQTCVGRGAGTLGCAAPRARPRPRIGRCADTSIDRDWRTCACTRRTARFKNARPDALRLARSDATRHNRASGPVAAQRPRDGARRPIHASTCIGPGVLRALAPKVQFDHSRPGRLGDGREQDEEWARECSVWRRSGRGAARPGRSFALDGRGWPGGRAGEGRVWWWSELEDQA
jgi:hypothetical protein